jgi:hypothetical protein
MIFDANQKLTVTIDGWKRYTMQNFRSEFPGAGASWVGPAPDSLISALKSPHCLVGGDNQAVWVFLLFHRVMRIARFCKTRNIF